MSVERRDRLAKLVKLERRLKDFHETKRAGHLADANRAAEEAAAIAARIDAPDTLSNLFPDVYFRGIEIAAAAERGAMKLAEDEARHVAASTVRAGRVEEQWRAASRAVDEKSAETERQEMIDRKR